MRHSITTILTAAAVASASAVASAETLSTQITGAWASGETLEACDTAPITHFMSDGVVAVFLKRDGALHSSGAWSANESELTMTHNDFPLSGDGRSKTPVMLEIVKLDENQFVTKNAEGRERARIRCSDIEITMGHDHDAH